MPDRRRRARAGAALSQRLRRAPVPGAAAAEERARRVVLATPVEPPRRRRAPVRVGAAVAALVAALATLTAVTPPGDAIARWVRQLVAPAATPPPRAALDSLPAAGRLLVTGPGGVWVVRRDGSRRRLGPYRDASWSPQGLFVAVTRGRTLLAVEPGGTVRWALARPSPVRDPRWSPNGYRIAYRAGGDMRVVAGDGSGDHALARGVAHVPAAWQPNRTTLLALARRGGRVETWMAHSPVRLGWWRVKAPVALGWTPGGTRLVVVRRGGVTVLDLRRARPVLRRAVPGVHGGAVSPDGRTVALVHGGTLTLVPLGGGPSRTVYASPDRLDSVTWSPDGRLLLVAVPRADQWLFLPVRGAGRVVANGGVARQFDPSRRRPRGFPSVAGWTR